MEEDLKKKGLYYAEDIPSALAQFRDRVPHDLIAIDGDSIKGEDLEKNLIKLSNRILVIYEGADQKINELQQQRKIVVAQKDEIDKCKDVEEVYYKMWLLWMKKFFNFEELPPLYLLFAPEEWIKNWRDMANWSKYINVKDALNINEEGAIIDHHFLNFPKIEENYFDGDNILEPKESFYYEGWDKGSYLSFIINSPPNGYELLHKILEFIEMGLLRVIVLDERIAEKALLKRGIKGEPLWKTLNLQGIYIVSHLLKDGKEKEVSPNIRQKANTLEIKREKDNLIIKLNEAEIHNKFHCFIGHKTLLNNPDFYPYLGVKDDLKKWIDEMGKHIPFIILDSGRGEVDIPQNAKFLPYSYLEEVIIENTSKYKLTKTILRLTRSVK